MGTRIAAGLLGLAILLPAIIWGGVLAVVVLAGLVLLIAQDEFAAMALPEHKTLARIVLFPGGLAVFLASAFAPDKALIPVLALSLMLGTILPMLKIEDVAKASEAGIRMGFGLLYVPVLLSCVVWIRREEDGLALIFLLLAITWLGDTGAYFAGRFTGKTPLFPRVSPKKTREGLVGGILLAVVGALVVKQLGAIDLPWGLVAVLGVVLDLAGVLGDLVESMLKRAFGVKDSGWIMPGHGGILDRIDSLLFSGPLLWLCLLLRDSFR
jgi:phosphatidate cytidylyltransferase